jgi:hypothetical protein
LASMNEWCRSVLCQAAHCSTGSWPCDVRSRRRERRPLILS